MFLVCSFVNCFDEFGKRPWHGFWTRLGDWMAMSIVDRIPRRARGWVFALALVLPVLLVALALRLLLP